MACIYQSTRLTPISEGFSQVLFLWKMPCSQVLTFSTLWKTLWKFTGFSQGLSQVFSQGKNSQGFSQGFAWVLTLWKLPFSQGLNSFTPCEKGVKNMWETMWNWTVHMFFHSLIHRFFTAFSRFHPIVIYVCSFRACCSVLLIHLDYIPSST